MRYKYLILIAVLTTYIGCRDGRQSAQPAEKTKFWEDYTGRIRYVTDYRTGLCFAGLGTTWMLVDCNVLKEK